MSPPSRASTGLLSVSVDVSGSRVGVSEVGASFIGKSIPSRQHCSFPNLGKKERRGLCTFVRHSVDWCSRRNIVPAAGEGSSGGDGVCHVEWSERPELYSPQGKGGGVYIAWEAFCLQLYGDPGGKQTRQILGLAPSTGGIAGAQGMIDHPSASQANCGM